jgi:hypothetical protein
MIKKYLLLAALFVIQSEGFAYETLKHELYVCADMDLGNGKWVTVNGIFRRDSLNNYSTIVRDTPGISDLVFDPRNHAYMYVASINGPLTTYDRCHSWRMGADWRMTEAKSIDMDSGNFDRIYLALPDGVAISEDKGKSWTRREAGLPLRGKYAQAIKSDRTQTGRVLVGIEKGIYLSVDSGTNWICVFESNATVTDIQQSPLNSKEWIATTKKDGALKSNDGGLTWHNLHVPAKNALYNVAFDSINPSHYAIASLLDGVLTSEDAGNTWNFRNSGLPKTHPIFRVAIDPDTQVLYAAVNREYIYSSNDFGRTWRKDGLNHSTVYHFVFLPVTKK